MELPPRARKLMSGQAEVVSRRQLLAAGVAATDVRRLLRRRVLTQLHPGVYVGHSGPPDPLQQSWGAVLSVAPAALFGRSVLAHLGLRSGCHSPVHVAIDASRTAVAPEGLVVHRVRRLAERLDHRPGPPRMCLEEAVLDVVATEGDDFAVVAVLAEAVSSRWTSAARIGERLSLRGRIARRELIGAVLADIETGACSVLERAYLRDVEQAHGLPSAGRQVRASSRGTVYRDVDYEALGLVVELDGRLDHTHVRDRDRDLDRDLDAAVDGRLTVRLGHGQVVGRPCATAVRLDRLMQRRGWRGRMRRCPSCP